MKCYKCDLPATDTCRKCSNPTCNRHAFAGGFSGRQRNNIKCFDCSGMGAS